MDHHSKTDGKGSELSRKWDVWCVDCGVASGLEDANHEERLITQIANLGMSLKHFAASMKKTEMVDLTIEGRTIPMRFFELHGEHRLMARDEFGEWSDYDKHEDLP